MTLGIFENNSWAKPTNQPTGAVDEYVQRHLMSTQWRGFLGALAAELFTNFSAEEAAGFLRAVGRRMALDTPHPKLNTLHELEAALNATFDQMRWGQTRLTVEGRDILIQHIHYPELPATGPTQEHWRQSVSAVLEGLYTVWLQAQGASADMQAQVQTVSGGGVAEFRFGYTA